MNKTAKRILDYDGKTLVEIILENGETKGYAVVRGFNPDKPYGDMWDHAVGYFDIVYSGKENNLKKAMQCLLGIKDCVIPSERMTELATKFKDKILELKELDDKLSDEDYESWKEEFDMTDKEMEFFGIEKKPRLKKVKAVVTQLATAEIYVLIPEDASEDDIFEYIYKEDISDSDWKYEEPEIERVHTVQYNADVDDYECINANEF